MKKVLVYSHDTYGLGNIRRMLAICEHLCDVHPDISILVASGSPMLHAFRLSPRIDYVKLPCLTRTLAGEYEVKSLGLDYDATISMRSEILTAVTESFRPDLILVDKKPFGVDEELRSALIATRSWDRPPALVLLLRDILDAPDTTTTIWRKNDYYGTIASYFDSVLVLGSAEVFDLPSEYDFPAEASLKVHFCGYLDRAPGLRSRSEVRAELGLDAGTKLVVVTPGGGEDGAQVVGSYVAALRAVGSVEHASLIIAGPELPSATRAEAHRLAADMAGVSVLDFTDDMASYLHAADAVVCMGGYNTVCEVLSAHTTAVVIPRVRPVIEQLIRAELLAERGIVSMIHPDALSSNLLLATIETSLTSARSIDDGLDMSGLDRVEKHLAGLIGDA